MSGDQPSPEARIVRSKSTTLNTVLFTLVGMMLLIHFFVLLFIVPKFQEMFIEMGVGERDMPLPVLLSNVLKKCWFIVIPAFIAGGFALRKRMSTRDLVVLMSVMLMGLLFYLTVLFTVIID